tara:strand:+ start:1433 stop:1876 length:444 start_codon:yes stop_codon:yes gene_type:complete
MKKLIILLLFPLVSFSQISYKDIMSIDSEKMFKKVMIENSWRNKNNNYEEKRERENNGRLYYRWYSEVGSINIDGWYYFGEERFGFLFLYPQIKTFNSIWDIVKKRCVFFDVIDDYVCYDCSGSKYKGVIGFKTINDRFGMIEQFPK